MIFDVSGAVTIKGVKVDTFDDKLYTACGYVTPHIVMLTLLIKRMPSVVMFVSVSPLIVKPLLKSVGDDLKGFCEFFVNAIISTLT